LRSRPFNKERHEAARIKQTHSLEVRLTAQAEADRARVKALPSGVEREETASAPD
jgi:hypothetical protein